VSYRAAPQGRPGCYEAAPARDPGPAGASPPQHHARAARRRGRELVALEARVILCPAHAEGDPPAGTWQAAEEQELRRGRVSGDDPYGPPAAFRPDPLRLVLEPSPVHGGAGPGGGPELVPRSHADQLRPRRAGEPQVAALRGETGAPGGGAQGRTIPDAISGKGDAARRAAAHAARAPH